MIKRWFERRFKDDEAALNTIVDFCMFGAGILLIQLAGYLLVEFVPMLYR